MNEEASDKVLEVEQFYNEIRRPVYNKRNDIIHNIPDFWLTAVCFCPLVLRALVLSAYWLFSFSLCATCLAELCRIDVNDAIIMLKSWCLQFLSHPVLCDLLTEDDQKVSFSADTLVCSLLLPL